ncbi:MAG: hypothetical protein IPL96_08435 [Holophagaceae bacterium]|nr:hypothetical protein [Holophagaceae bacterium]
MAQARALAAGRATDPFKPLAGLLALPLTLSRDPWLAGRLLFLGLQCGLGWAIWQILPRTWDRGWKAAGLALLWLEPTFRERILEMRTDGVAALLVVLATLAWHAAGRRSARLGVALAWGVALAVAPKTFLWGLPWGVLALLLPRAEAEPAKRRWADAAWAALGAAVVFVLIWQAGALCTGRTLVGLLAASRAQNAGALGVGGLFPPLATFYLGQVLLYGLPFYGLVLLGLTTRKGFAALSPASRHWVCTGLAVWLVAPCYPGSFPYHFVGLIPPLLPLALLGLRRLAGWFGAKGVVTAMAFSLVFAAWALAGVLEGPDRASQVRLLRYAEGFLSPGLGYVDGVGALSKPQSAFFVTATALGSPDVARLRERWGTEQVSLFLLDGRAEQLMAEERLEWIKARCVQVHPNLVVLGTLAQGELQLNHTWEVPWSATFRFRGTPSWSWTLNGRAIKPGDDVLLAPGPLDLTGTGPGKGGAVVSLSPGPEAAPAPHGLRPFFLPFQRY